MNTVETLQAEYDRLHQQCGGFDAETIRLQREGDEKRRQWQQDRKRLRSELVRRKGEVYEQLTAAKAKAKADAEAEKIAAEALSSSGQTKPVVITAPIDLPAGAEVTPGQEATERRSDEGADPVADQIDEKPAPQQHARNRRR